MMEKYKILIVEDDVDLREGLSFSFSGDGYDVTETGTKRMVYKKSQTVVMILYFGL